MKKIIISIVMCILLIALNAPSVVYAIGSSEPFFLKEENGEPYYLVNNGDELKILLEGLISSRNVRHVLLNNDTFYLNDVTIDASNHFVFEKYGSYQKCTFISTYDDKSMFFIDDSAEGLIMDFSSHNITLTSSIKDKSSTNGTGGVFDIYTNNVTLIGGEYVDCATYDSGGAIYIWGSHPWSDKVLGKECTIKDAKFHQCSSQSGGAITIKGLNGVVDNCHFWYCSSVNQRGGTDGGGAIKILNDNSKITNCDFHYCTALEGGIGGAVEILGYNCYIGNSFFERNSARGDGGAIYIEDDATIEDCKFQYNSASGDGGSIYDNNAAGDVYIRRCTFRAGDCGGDGIWVACNGDAHIVECTDNKSEDYYDSPASYTSPDLYPYDDFEGYEDETPYSRPEMTDYARYVMKNNPNCDVIRPNLGEVVKSDHNHFNLYGSNIYGAGWKIDYQNPLNISSQDSNKISRIEIVVTEGKRNYDGLFVDRGKKGDMFVDPRGMTNRLDVNYIIQINDIDSYAVNLRTDGNIYDNKAIQVREVIVYYSGGYTGSVLSEGNLTIIAGAICLGLGLVIGIVIGKKSKKNNTETTNTIDEKDE